jgi:hypothetical protein
MANWYGAARTNYVRVEDLEGLKKALEPFSVTARAHPVRPEFVTIQSDDEYGGWPSSAYVQSEEEDGEEREIEFDFAVQVMPFIKEGEVLVAIESGAEKLRYISGSSQAYTRVGDEVKSTFINLNKIIEQASKEFNIPAASIADCSYQDLPSNLESQTHREKP